MAYVTRDIEDEEEEKQQQQQQASGTPTFRPGAAVSSNGMPAPQQTPQQQKGSGFVNLDSWLNAGKGRDAAITSTGATKIGAEKDTFNAAAKPVEDATFSATTYGNMWEAGADVDKAAASGDTSGLEKNVSQTYGGPREVNYDATKQQNLWDTEALTSADTAGSVLGRKAMDAGEYSRGAQALDRVLFGADAASQQAMGGVKNERTAFTDDVKKRSESAGKKVADFDKLAADANVANKARLGEYGGEIVKRVDNRVADALAKEKEARGVIAGGTHWIDAEGKAHTLAGGESVGDIVGGGAKQENMITGQESAGLAALNKILGMPTIQKTGDYQGVSTTVNKDPNWAPPLPSRGGYDPRPGTVTEMLDGDINDPSTPKGAYHKAWSEAGYPGGNGDTVALKQFLDDFQRAHPEIKLPTGEESDAFERRKGSPGKASERDQQISDFDNEVISTPFGAMKRGDWNKLQGNMSTKDTDDEAQKLLKIMSDIFGGG
jgi:hypothetical protein